MGRSQRERGKRGEREAAKAVQDALGIQARRGVQYKGGEDSPDIATSVPGVHWEVKFVEREQVRAWMAQAEQDARGQVPVLLHRKSRAPWLVTIPLERLRELVNKLAETVSTEVQAMGQGAVPCPIPGQVVSATAITPAGDAGLFRFQ